MTTDSSLLIMRILALLVLVNGSLASEPKTIFLYRILGAGDQLDLTDEDCSRFNNTPVGEEQDFSLGEIENRKEIWMVIS